jgi:hypothetical protein
MAVQEQTTTTAKDAFTQPFLQYGMQEALKQYQQGAPAYFPGQTYAAFSPQTEQALAAQEQRALTGSPVMQGAEQYAQDVLSGSFLGSNPYLQGAIQRATEPAQASAMSALAQRGRLGSGLGAQQVAQTVGDIAANMSFADYTNERSRQQAMAQYAPQLAQAGYYDIGQLANVGAAREQQAQKAITDAMNRYQYEQTAPITQLQNYQNLIAGFPMGGTQTTLTPYDPPTTAERFLGSAAAVGSLFPDNATFSERLPYLLGGGLIGAYDTNESVDNHD